ncbi:MAG: hypothetical protein ACJATP_002703 [Candidatus Azotimanducaceae bacterium]|jgi:hypothetical protein
MFVRKPYQYGLEQMMVFNSNTALALGNLSAESKQRGYILGSERA